MLSIGSTGSASYHPFRDVHDGGVPRGANVPVIVMGVASRCARRAAPGAEFHFLVDRLDAAPGLAPLAAGAQVTFLCRVPEGLPASSARVRYLAHAHVARAGHPGLRRSFELSVLAAQTPAARHAARLHFTGAGDDGRTGFEATCEWSVVRAGGRARLRLHVAEGRGRGRVRAELRGTLTRRDAHGVGHASVFAVHTSETDIHEDWPGRPVDLVIDVPRDAQPSFDAELASLSWRLHVSTRLGWRTWRGEMPIEIIDAVRPAQATAAPLPDLPAARPAPVARAAPVGPGRFTARMADAVVTIDRVWHDGWRDAGWYLAGALEYPALELGLSIHPANLWQRWRGGDPGIADATWDRRHQVDTPDPAQTGAFLAELRAALQPLGLDVLDDTHARVRRREQDGDDQERLAGDLRTLAEAIARARLRIPPPRGMANALEGWRRLAERLDDGRLTTASMCISARFRGLPARVATVWTADRRPRYTRVALTPPAPLRLPEGGQRQALIAELAPGALAVSLGEHELAVDLRAPLDDPEEAYGHLVQLGRVLDRLRTAAGAYR